MGFGAGGYSRLFNFLFLQGFHRTHSAATLQDSASEPCPAGGQQPRLSIWLAQGRCLLGLAVVSRHRCLCHGCLPGRAPSRKTEAGFLRVALCFLCRLGRFGDHPLVLRIRGRGHHRQRHRNGCRSKFQNKAGLKSCRLLPPKLAGYEPASPISLTAPSKLPATPVLSSAPVEDWPARL